MNSRRPYDENIFEATRMSLGEHLDELRACLLKSIYGLAIAFVACLIFREPIINFLAQPLLWTLKANGLNTQLYATNLPEFFITVLKICLIAALFVSSPWVFYQIWSFIAKGLYPAERKFVHIFIPFSAFLFILGGVFFIVVVAPICFNFFITFATNFDMPELKENPISGPIIRAIKGNKDDTVPDAAVTSSSDTQSERTELTFVLPFGVTLEVSLPFPPPEGSAVDGTSSSSGVKPHESLIQFIPKIDQYVSLVLILALGFSLAFQMPLAVFFLGRLGLVTVAALGSGRKYVFIGILVVAAIITPPDVISQIALSIPMYLLYEIGIILLRLWPPRATTVPRSDDGL